MNKIKILYIGICILIYATGCTIGEKRLELDSDEKKMEMILVNVLEFIESQDYEGMKSLFSEKALSESGDFEEDMDYLIDFFEGDVISWEISTGPIASGRIEGGKKLAEIVMWYNIETSENNYVMFILNYDKDDFEQINEGVYSIRVVLEENRDTEMTVWQDMMIPGIYNPNKEGIYVAD